MSLKASGMAAGWLRGAKDVGGQKAQVRGF